MDMANTGAPDPSAECACGVGRVSPQGLEDPVCLED